MLSSRRQKKRPTTDAVISPLDIAEILELIFSFLSKPVLEWVTVRVCRRWYQASKQSLGRHLHLDPLNTRNWKSFSSQLYNANKITIGRTITPGTLTLDPNVQRLWDDKLLLLSKDLSSTATGPTGDRIHKEDTIRVRALNLSFDRDILCPERILSWFNLRILTDLSIDMPYAGGPVPLEAILRECPNLQALSLSAHKYHKSYVSAKQQFWITSFERDHPWLPPKGSLGALVPLYSYDHTNIVNNNTSTNEDQSQTHYQQHKPQQESIITSVPLRSLRIENIIVSPAALGSYLPLLSSLQRFYLVHPLYPPYGGGEVGFRHLNDATNQFWIRLSITCPELETVHVRCRERSNSDMSIPLDRFPLVHDWGLHFDFPKLRQLSQNHIEDRLTHLELYSLYSDGEYSKSDSEQDKCLHRILFACPLLVHLRILGRIYMTTDFLWDPDHPERIWACRGLKTLSFQLDTYKKNSYRTATATNLDIFSYLSRVCPQLQDLELCVEPCVLGLENGLCLLTRLRNLERLKITIAVRHAREGSFEETDFCWIARPQPTPALVTLSTGSVSGLWKLVSSNLVKKVVGSDSRKKRHGSHYGDDYQYCLEKIRSMRSFTNNFFQENGRKDGNVEKARSRMRQQQEENRYRTDRDEGRSLSLPLVDGLDGLTFCGSLLDIEARLRAQMFSERQKQQELEQHQQLERIQDATADEGVTMSALGFQQQQHLKPWPFLQSLEISFLLKSLVDKNLLETRAEYLQNILRQLRPDIRKIDMLTFCNNRTPDRLASMQLFLPYDTGATKGLIPEFDKLQRRILCACRLLVRIGVSVIPQTRSWPVVDSRRRRSNIAKATNWEVFA
ncbi:hypothetical protein BGZ83_001487 [Gryganskiella cystojenkinii]|nr:hypothetical protein BGZ83_001487 [Gryganskiella cystojenkinii]